MDTESVRSGYSERSRRATNRVTHGILQSEGSNVIANPLSSSPYNDLSTNNRLNFINQPNRSLNRNSHHQHHHNNHGDPIYSSKLNSSLSANTPPNNSSTRQPPTISSINDYRRAEEVTVQILPQDDRWADNTTAITGNTSEHSMSIDVDINKLGKTNQWDDNNFYRFKSDVWCVPLYCGIVSICAFLSPIIMLLLPKIDSLDWKVKECGPECDGYLISFIFKLTILLLCSWAVFCHKPRAILPQIHTYRAIIMALLILLIITYWLFYSERIYDRRFNDYELTYENVVQFTVPFVDLLLWIHFAAIILIYWKHKQIYYQAKVIRSPDGESRTYNVGDLCIQTAAVMILDKYYKDFSIYNPYLEVLPVRSERRGKHSRRGGDNHHHFDHHNHSNSNVISNPSTMKYYDLDGLNNHHNHQGNGGVGMSAGILSSSTAQLNSSTSRLVNGDSLIAGDSNDNNNLDDRSSRRGDTRTTSHHHERHSHHHHDRYYEEHEYDRRVRKRKARLLAASEEAFTHIKRIRADEPCKQIKQNYFYPYFPSSNSHIINVKINIFSQLSSYLTISALTIKAVNISKFFFMPEMRSSRVEDMFQIAFLFFFSPSSFLLPNQ